MTPPFIIAAQLLLLLSYVVVVSQLKRVECKLNQLDEIHALMQAEREQLERARMQVFAERLGAGRPTNGAPIASQLPRACIRRSARTRARRARPAAATARAERRPATAPLLLK